MLFAIACIYQLARIDYRQRISTDVLDLIPTAEQSPEAGVLRSLASDTEARVMLFALKDRTNPTEAPSRAAAEFAAALVREPTFAEAVVSGDTAAQDELGKAIFDQRFSLLLPTWLAQQEREFAATGLNPAGFSPWLADRVAVALQDFLAQPEAVALQELVTHDPLLLVPRLIKSAQGLAPSTSSSPGSALVWARIKDSPLSESGQAPVFAAIDRALQSIQKDFPGVELRWTGVNRFAAESRRRIEREFGVLNIFSVLAVLAVGCLFVRRLWKIAHLVPVILLSLLGAWTVATAVFPRIHVLVFIIGSLLSGVAIDYGFYIYLQPRLAPDEPYIQKLRRLLKPLLASCLTTVIGFSLLLFSDLPLLRQVGLFVGAGLLCALGAAMLYFAQLKNPQLETREYDLLPRRSRRASWRPAVQALAALALVIALIAPWRLRWRDDVRELEIASPELTRNDAALRKLFGDSDDRTAYLTHGRDVAEARDHLDIFLQALARDAKGANFATLGLVFPTKENWEKLPARLARLPNFSRELQAALDQHGFEADGFADFFREWDAMRTAPPRGQYEDLYKAMAPHLTGPLGMLYRAEGNLCWFLTIVDQREEWVPPPELDTIALNQLESLNGLFTRYRWSALHLSLAGLTLVIASVFAIYRGRAAVRIALIPAGSCFFVLGVLGLCGQTLNLFHLLGAFLGVCLSHNYAIFSGHAAAGGAQVPPTSIRLSALCTAASFGVLACSHIPVIHALGLTVALIVLVALTVVELEPLARKGAS